MVDAGFVDTFRLFKQGNGHYTWWSNFANSRARNVGWRIDYFLVSDKLRRAVKSAKIHADVLGSDRRRSNSALSSSASHVWSTTGRRSHPRRRPVPATPK